MHFCLIYRAFLVTLLFPLTRDINNIILSDKHEYIINYRITTVGNILLSIQYNIILLNIIYYIIIIILYYIAYFLYL